ncbi:hypothetical protein L7F22_057853 [Adiantum nelumboides]|nr:hypothetical protein [Adiantum nelumboides]
MTLPISSIHFGGQIVKDVTELNSGWKEYTSKVELDPVKQDLLESQLLRFRDLHDVDFGSAQASLREAHLKPVSWWEKYGGDCPDLQHIALRVLSQDCSSGACERNWSLFAAIHTKKRNCLFPIQLKRLVFVNSNLKLLQKREKTKSINEINPESLKIEIRLAELVHPTDEDDEVWAFLAAEREQLQHQTRTRTSTVGRGRGRGNARGRSRGEVNSPYSGCDLLVMAVFSKHRDFLYVAVGNEPFLTSYNGSYLNITYPALVNIQSALNSAGYGGTIKATVPMNADVIQGSGGPSASIFRPDISALMTQIVQYLSQNGAPYTINIYPFISLHEDSNFPVDYAFFEGSQTPVKDGAFTYQNVFDASFDSLIASLAAAGPYGSMKIIVGEIGWPTDGDVNANVDYAKKFNQGFLNHVRSNTGTPRRPNTAIDFYIFSLIDEDQKSIRPGNFEPHWGLFEYDGKPKYDLSLSGANGQVLVQASGVKYLTTEWCVYNPSGGDQSKLGDSITYACENSDCTSLGYGSSCNPYLDAAGNASYAFNQYFQRYDQGPDTCDFNGMGQVVTKNPSKGNCEFIIQIQEPSLSGGDQSSNGGLGRLWEASTSVLITLIFMTSGFLWSN